MDLNFDDNFKITLLAMKINRSDPAIKRDMKWIIQFLFGYGVYTLLFALLMYNIICVNLQENDFSQMCRNATLCVVYYAMTFQYLVLVWKQQHFKILMDNIKRDYDLAQSLPIEEQRIIREFALKGNYVCKQWLLVAFGGTVLFPIKNALLITYTWITDGEIRLIPLMDLVYPLFMEEKKNTMIVFLNMYILCFWGLFCTAVMLCAFVPLGPIFMLHACGQLDVVKKRIEGLFDSDDFEEVTQNLKDIVKQLQYIYEFVDRIKLCFRMAYEMALKVTMVILPLTCYELKESLKQGELSFDLVMFFIGGILFSSAPCYYSELLMEKGEGVRLAMYFCNWERMYNRGIWSSIVIILQRAQRPIALRSLFRTMCLEILAELFQQSFAIFNLMNAMWN